MVVIVIAIVVTTDAAIVGKCAVNIVMAVHEIFYVHVCSYGYHELGHPKLKKDLSTKGLPTISAHSPLYSDSFDTNLENIPLLKRDLGIKSIAHHHKEQNKIQINKKSLSTNS